MKVILQHLKLNMEIHFPFKKVGEAFSHGMMDGLPGLHFISPPLTRIFPHSLIVDWQHHFLEVGEAQVPSRVPVEILSQQLHLFQNELVSILLLQKIEDLLSCNPTISVLVDS